MAEPYLPKSETQILAYLPTKLTPLSNRIKKLESRLISYSADNRQMEELQEALLKAYLQQARVAADMRYLSYAQKRLDQWLQKTPDSEKARLLDAQIKQYNHHFDDAIVVLTALLKDYPNNSEAWSLLSNLQLLTGNYVAASASCKQLSLSSNLAELVICQSNIKIRTGLLNEAYTLLSVLLPVIDNMPIEQQLWLVTSLAEITIQQDKKNLAERYLKQAVTLAANNDINDAYLTRVYTDFLIQHSRFKLAFELTKNNKGDAGLMIRSAVLAKKTGDDQLYYDNKAALIQIFDVEKRRQKNRHLRELALFTLLLLDDATAALTIAKQNWLLQKEPEDARILMKSALTVGDHEQIHWVEAAIERTGLIDLRLDKVRLGESII